MTTPTVAEPEQFTAEDLMFDLDLRVEPDVRNGTATHTSYVTETCHYPTDGITCGCTYWGSADKTAGEQPKMCI